MTAALPLTWLSLFLCVAFLLPNHYSPWLSFHQEALTAIAGAPVVLWAAFHVKRVPLGFWLWGALALTPLIQWFFGLISYVGDAWLYVVFLMGSALMMLAGHVVASQAKNSVDLQRQMMPVWVAVVIAGMVSVGLAMHQWLDLGLSGVFIADLPPGGRPFANLAQPNHLATLLLLSSVGVWYCWEVRKLGSFVATLLIAFFAAGMVLTGSRSVWLALAWMLPFIAWARGRCGLRLRFVYVLSLTVFFFALSFAKPVFEEWLILVDTGSAVERVGQTHLRLLAWRAFIDAALTEPWWGFGWGQVAEAQFRVALDHPGMTDIFFNTHNFLLDLVIWLGFPCALIVICTLVAWLAMALHRCHAADTFMPLMAICIVTGHSMVEFPIAYAYFLVPTSFWVGVVAARVSVLNADATSSFSGAQRTVAVLVSLATLALTLQIIREYIPYENDWREQQYVEARISGARTQGTTQPLMLDQLEAMMRLQRFAPLEQPNQDGGEWIGVVAERYPYPSFRYKYAVALAIDGHPDLAHDQLSRVCAVFPKRVCERVKNDWAREAIAKPRLAAVDLLSMP